MIRYALTVIELDLVGNEINNPDADWTMVSDTPIPIPNVGERFRINPHPTEEPELIISSYEVIRREYYYFAGSGNPAWPAKAEVELFCRRINGDARPD